MTIIVNNGLSAPHRTVIMRAAVASVAFLLLCSFADDCRRAGTAAGEA